MKISNKVKILGIIHKTDRKCRFIEKSGYLGAFSPTKALISLSSSELITDNKIKETYLHEICHGINNQLDIFPDELEERLVNRLSNCLYMVFLDNKTCFHHEKIPKSVKIGGLIYKINLTADMFDSVLNKQLYIEDRLTTINIDAGTEVTKETIESNFLMGLLIAIDYQFHIFDEISDDLKNLDAFSNALYKVMKDNKELCFCES